MVDDKHKLTKNDPSLRITPDDCIEFINTNYPQFKGMCYYEDDVLKSEYPLNIQFYFDPFHSVLEIRQPNQKRKHELIELCREAGYSGEIDVIRNKIVHTEHGLKENIPYVNENGKLIIQNRGHERTK